MGIPGILHISLGVMLISRLCIKFAFNRLCISISRSSSWLFGSPKTAKRTPDDISSVSQSFVEWLLLFGPSILQNYTMRFHWLGQCSKMLDKSSTTHQNRQFWIVSDVHDKRRRHKVWKKGALNGKMFRNGASSTTNHIAASTANECTLILQARAAILGEYSD